MDIDPDEFEVLEPRKRHGMPLLQITDFLVNGAGFSRRLAESDGSETPLVVRLIKSMLDDKDDPLVARFYSDDHRKTCRHSCYRCLQRYGNRQYHGLLDWRLGLGFLRAMINVDYRSGLDRRWNDFPEISDWPDMAASIRDELCQLNPAERKPVKLGVLGLPGIRVRSNGKDTYYALVHPLWKIDERARRAPPFAGMEQDTGGAMPYFVDAFDAVRRPVSALDFAKERPNDR
jgi:hypothetical protein